MSAIQARGVRIPPVGLDAELLTPAAACGLVVFAHGSGSSRLSPRNRAVAEALGEAGYAALLMDLLTEDEAADRANVFDIGLLGSRLVAAIDWAAGLPQTGRLPVGLFGASTGAAAAISAAAARPEQVRAVVSRGGRPDLAGRDLARLAAPTLLIVGGADPAVIDLNAAAMRRMNAPVRLEIVPGATHLFEEAGTLEEVARLAIAWFDAHLAAPAADAADSGGRGS